MSRLLICLIVLSVLPSLASAQRSTAADDDQTKQLVISLETKTYELTQKKDEAGYLALLADDFQDVGDSGVIDKYRSVAAAVDARMKMDSYSLRNVRFSRLAPTVVLLTYEARVVGTYDGKPLPSLQFVSSVWVERNGKWLNVLYQNALAAPNEAKPGKTPSQK